MTDDMSLHRQPKQRTAGFAVSVALTVYYVTFLIGVTALALVPQ
ncbi:hypothetical protein O7599_03310 [Streptomyces sp. WMMC500]|nr:hypothetical protein [Streptomyces sp. WMMC500]WBB61599.1 hypothetical protein O7599_03310 [Streptomyces sp. WMMC500]